MADYDLNQTAEGVYMVLPADRPAGVALDASWLYALATNNADLLQGILDGSTPVTPSADIYVDGLLFDNSNDTLNLTLTDNDGTTPNVVQSLAHAWGMHTDVDMATVAPAAGDRAVFDGANWVPFQEAFVEHSIGVQNINAAGGAAGNDLDMTTAGASVAFGQAFTNTAAGDAVPVAGTYEVEVHIPYTTTGVRYSPILSITIDGAQQERKGKMGYVRAASGDNEGSVVVSQTFTLAAGQVIGANVVREGTNAAAANTVAGEANVRIRRIN